jgi:hypothetical protein
MQIMFHFTSYLSDFSIRCKKKKRGFDASDPRHGPFTQNKWVNPFTTQTNLR